mmetsp:Transcript_17853/g.30300  ORF Transcript_17853/g.30300 Transcript_17853/m.30300 type:complete len:578 (+) Transcript_17853:575-2308(+)
MMWMRTIRGGVSKHSLTKAVFRSFQREYIIIVLMNAIQATLQMSSPFVIKPLIQYVKTGENAWDVHYFDPPESGWLSLLTPEKQYGLTLSLILVLTQAVSYLLSEQIQFKQSMIGSKSTNALVGLIYEKQFRISSATNKLFKQGEIITFVQVDSEKMQYLASQLPAVATLPFTLSLGFTLLFTALGASFFAGIFVFFVSLLVNIFLSRKLAVYQKAYMKKQDARVNSTTECLNNIKIIKLYSWVDIFKETILKNRNIELGVLRSRMIYLSITLGSIVFFPLALQIASFTSFIGLGHYLDLATAYQVITVFNLINGPIRMLPMFIGQFIEFTVAMRRIQKFILCDEINDDLVHKHAREDAEYAVEMRDAVSYHWGIHFEANEEGKAESKHRKLLASRKAGGQDLKEKFISEESAKRQQERTVENQKLSNFIALKQMDFRIKRGEFVCVIGDVGSGKSSLLSAMIGDMLHLPQNVFQKHEESKIWEDKAIQMELYSASRESQFSHGRSPISISSSISYAQQTPWIQNKTIKENIIFGAAFDQARYDHTIKICELTRDIEILPAGDMTEIGEKGINLSGG